MKKTIILISYLCITSIFSIGQPATIPASTATLVTIAAPIAQPTQTAENAKLDKLQNSVDSLTILIKNYVNLSESPIRFTIGTNFSNLKTPDFRSYYARLSFYKDGLFLKNYRKNKIRFCSNKVNSKMVLGGSEDITANSDSILNSKEFRFRKKNRILQKLFYDTTENYSGIPKRIDLGFYMGFFRQSYLDFLETPNTISSENKISKVTATGFTVTKSFYSKDSSFYYTDQTGFFISPNILLFTSKVKNAKKDYLLTLRANVDFEFLQTKQTNQFIKSFIDSITYPVNSVLPSIDSSINSFVSAPSNLSRNTITNQMFKGIGFSVFYIDKKLEVLYKAAFGKVRIFDNLDAKDFYLVKFNYNTHYFSATHLSSGIRIGGEVRNLIVTNEKDNYGKTNKILFNIYIAYTTDLSELFRRFSKKF
jgi:hypothetical protein